MTISRQEIQVRKQWTGDRVVGRFIYFPVDNDDEVFWNNDMCGITGYIGKRAAQSVLIDSLTKLEYRGYDSCGIAVGCSPLAVYKDAVRIGQLKQTLPTIPGKVGIGHTRWATHGEPSQINSHPHTDCSGKIAVVHNGVVDNYLELRQQLISEGHLFLSETDTEVIPHLIEKYYLGDIQRAVEAALNEISGTYAILVVTECEPKLIAARSGSPLIIGVADGEYIVASDVPAVLNYTNRIIYLEDGDIAAINTDSLKIFNYGVEVERKIHNTSWNAVDIQKTGYEHFMLKEIHEEPRVVRECLKGYPQAANLLKDAGLILDRDTQSLTIVACGTSYHAGLIGKYVIEELLGIPVRVEIASEFSHKKQIISTSKMIGISQSGETADVLTAMKKMKANGIKTVALTNVNESSISRIADQVVYTPAGPEVGVAATKTFIAQVITLYQIALSHPDINSAVKARFILELGELPAKIQRVLDGEYQIADHARYLLAHNQMFYIARGVNTPIALEGALKIKEIAYMHAEGYIAGELKHGPFALLTKDTPVVAIVAKDDNHRAMLTSIEEIKARKAPVIGLAEDGDGVIDKSVDFVLRVPSTISLLTPVINAVALQLLAYYTAKFRGCPIDFPRNLAKSVTVE